VGRAIMDGFIYVMSNPAFTLLKIGKSSKDPTKDRLSELSNHSGVPFKFKCEYFLCASNFEKIEARVHSSLKDLRPNDMREFFDISVGEAIKTIRSEAENIGKIKYEEIFSKQAAESIPDYSEKSAPEVRINPSFADTLFEILDTPPISATPAALETVLREAMLWSRKDIKNLPTIDGSANTITGSHKGRNLFGLQCGPKHTIWKKGQYWNLEKPFNPFFPENEEYPERGGYFYPWGAMYDGRFDNGMRTGRGRFWYKYASDEWFYRGQQFEDRFLGHGQKLRTTGRGLGVDVNVTDIRGGEFAEKDSIDPPF
jgi:hypothetical protein